jgi:GNAT superfamily N-acetyltransferase
MNETRYLRLWTETEERSEALCRAFYDGVYRDCFPESDETEDPDIWLPLMRPDPPYGKPRVFIICATQGDAGAPDERIQGGIVFELYRRSGDWLATYIAVREPERRKGLGRTLFNEMVRVIPDLAPNSYWQLFAEAENPLSHIGPRRPAMYHRLSRLCRLDQRLAR